MKKLVSLLLICMMVFTSTVNVFADYSSGTFHYVIEDDQIVITNCFGFDSEVVIPEMIAGRTVTKIAAGAFMNNNYVTKIYVPVTVSVIEPDAIKSGITVEFLSSYEDSKEEENQEIPPVSDDSDSKGDEDTTSKPNDSTVVIAPSIAPSKEVTAIVAPTIGEKEEIEVNETEEVIVSVDEKEVVLNEEDFNEEVTEKEVVEDNNHTKLYMTIGACVVSAIALVLIIKAIRNR